MDHRKHAARSRERMKGYASGGAVSDMRQPAEKEYHMAGARLATALTDSPPTPNTAPFDPDRAVDGKVDRTTKLTRQLRGQN